MAATSVSRPSLSEINQMNKIMCNEDDIWIRLSNIPDLYIGGAYFYEKDLLGPVENLKAYAEKLLQLCKTLHV